MGKLWCGSGRCSCSRKQQAFRERGRISRFQTMRSFTTGPQSTAWGMWNRAQWFGKERYKVLSRDLGLHLNRMELREAYSLHEILGYYMGELRREAQPHTLRQHWRNTVGTLRLFAPDTAEPSSLRARLASFNDWGCCPGQWSLGRESDSFKQFW